MEPAAAPQILLPADTLLLHIGPHKTGTTALQAALWSARPELLAQGVCHAGRLRNPASAVKAVVGHTSRVRGKVPPMSRWHELVREIRAAPEPRLVVSCERFSHAPSEAIFRIIDDLDPLRVHVVVTLRPLASLLASQWQQYVQHGVSASFEDWLDAVFNRRGSKLTPGFWQRHRHDQLVERWVGAAGADHVTVVALDERDRGMLLRTFEALLGLRNGTLRVPPGLANRSLTLSEIEAVRACHVALEAEDVERAFHGTMLYGAAQYLKRVAPDPEAAPIALPAWARERAAEVSREIVEAISRSGARIVGDLSTLAPGPDAIDAGVAKGAGACDGLSPKAAASLSMGVLIAAGIAREPDRDDNEAAELAPIPIPIRQLAGVIVERTRLMIRRRAASIGRWAPTVR